eukprot:14536-Hanusia_phi.AAC.2
MTWTSIDGEQVSTWLKYAKFETKHGTIAQGSLRLRAQAWDDVEQPGTSTREPSKTSASSPTSLSCCWRSRRRDEEGDLLQLTCEQFEEQVKEAERARAIYKVAPQASRASWLSPQISR